MGRIPDKPDQDSGKTPTRKLSDESRLSEQLDSLGSRINEKRQIRAKAEEKHDKAGSPGIAQALRLSSEFIAGIAVGAGLGYLVDTFAGTSPWGMILFLLLGFGAGVLNTLRSAGLVQETNLHLKADEKKRRDK